MKRANTLILLLILLAPSPALPCVAEFGYTSTDRSNIDSVVANVQVGAGYFNVQNEATNIVSDVQYVVSKAGPVFINLETIIFNPTPATVTTCPYERGQTGQTAAYINLRGNYQSRLDTFFSVNAGLFTGSRKVYGLIVRSEANNGCVEPWKLNAAASYIKTKLAAVAQYSPVYTIVGYDFRNTPAFGGKGPTASFGFPVASGSITSFPNQVDVIAYFVYDIFDPGNPSNSLNVNVESWTSLSGKLDQALVSGQKTLAVLKAFCDSGDPVEAAWGVTCPDSTHAAMAIWKIGSAASNWASYLRGDTRNLFTVGFSWPSGSPLVGSQDLSQIWSNHTAIQQQVNCSVP
jgi:hypothetical protein